MCAIPGSLNFIPEAILPTTLAAFAPYPWLTEFLSSPSSYTPVQTLHQHPTTDIPSAFMSSTLRVPAAILAVQSLYLPLPASTDSFSKTSYRSKSTSEAPLDGELLALYVLGAGLSGHRCLAHGGLVATLLDQQMGSLVIADSAILWQPRTVFCNVKYLSAVRVPGAFKVRAWKTSRTEGRKMWVKAEISMREKRLAEAEALVIGDREKL